MAQPDLTAVEIAQRIRDGALTSLAATEACLARIAERDDEVDAWAWLDPEAALAEAASRDASAVRGPLHGVPVAVKDLIDTADMPTEYGSPIYAGHRPTRDAAIVAALRAAGAVVLGKTVTTEFACFAPPKTRNPHDRARTPGGSSSGSAAAVAAGMAPLALGTQTVGSIIRPASFCGVFGFKPSYGLLSLEGVKPLASAFDTVGCFARSIDDVALWLEAVGGLAQAQEVRPTRIALIRTAHWDVASRETRSALEAAAGELAGGGVEIVEPDLPAELSEIETLQETLFMHALPEALATERRESPEKLTELLRGMLTRAEGVSDEAAERAAERAEAARRAMDALFAKVDLALAPAAAGEAPPATEGTGNPLFNRMATLLHGPSLSIPSARGPHGLPVGVQLIGRRGADAAFLGMARWCARQLLVDGAVPAV